MPDENHQNVQQEASPQGQEASKGAEVAPASAKPDITDWRQALPEDLQAAESLQNFKGVDDLAKSYVETKRLQGRSIQLLPEDASDEQRAAQRAEIMEKIPGWMPKPDPENADQNADFWKSLGKPAKADEYKAPDELKSSLKEDIGEIQVLADKANLTQSQFNTLVGIMDESAALSEQAGIEAFNEQIQELKGTWGAAYEQEYGKAQAVAEAVSRETGIDIATLFKNGTATADFVKIFNAVSKMVGGESVTVTQDKTTTDLMTPSEAQSALDAIHGNKEHPYWDKNLPAEQKAREQKRYVELVRLTKGGQK